MTKYTNLKGETSDYNFGCYENDCGVLVGQVVTSVNESSDEIVMEFDSGYTARFYHDQDCCESVVLDDVNGDWDDIVGVELLVAEERTSNNDCDYGSETWTFYTFRTIKGSVDVKWHGESNGYYSESVDLMVYKADADK